MASRDLTPPPMGSRVLAVDDVISLHERATRLLDEAVHSRTAMLKLGWFARRRMRRALRGFIVNAFLAEGHGASESGLEEELTLRVDALGTRWGGSKQDGSMRVFQELAHHFVFCVVKFLSVPARERFGWGEVERLADMILAKDVALALARELGRQG